MILGMVSGGRQLNAIQQWFAAGGAGHWWRPSPSNCFTDTAGTTPAAVGELVARMTDISGNGAFLVRHQLGDRPTLRYDSGLGVHYLECTGNSMSTEDSTAVSDWKWMHDGTEWLAVMRAMCGTSSNPNTIYYLLSTSAISATSIGTAIAYDDRSSASMSDAYRTYIARGVAGQPVVNGIFQNKVPPNTVVTLSSGYKHGRAGDDLETWVDSAAAGTAESGFAPSSSNPSRLAVGVGIGNIFPLTGRIYEIVLLRGAGSIAARGSIEAALGT